MMTAPASIPPALCRSVDTLAIAIAGVAFGVAMEARLAIPGALQGSDEIPGQLPESWGERAIGLDFWPCLAVL